MPKLSIIMPTYNGARFLGEQIESILGQDDDDFELVVTDDGSSDGTRALTEAYAARDARMRIVPSTGNLGQNSRLAQLIGEARGEYIAISDQDDRWAPDRNRRLFDALKGRAMALGRSELIDGDGCLKGETLLQRIPPAGWRPGPDVRLCALIKPMFSAHATIVLREFLSTNNLYSPVPFDWLLGLEALFSDGLVYVDDAVVFHRIHGGNQVNNVAAGSTRVSVRDLMLFRRPMRLNLWLILQFLAGSPRIAAPSRAIFRELAGRCHTSWFSQWRDLRTDGGLGRLLLDRLGPFAASPADHDAFAAHVRALTGRTFSSAFLAEAHRRFNARLTVAT